MREEARVPVPQACEFTGENIFGHETLCFFRIIWLLGSPKQGLCFCGCGAAPNTSVFCDSYMKPSSHYTVSCGFYRPHLPFKHFEVQIGSLATVLCTFCRQLPPIEPRICVAGSALLTLRECFSTWCDAPAGLWHINALARLRAAKHEWCCDAPRKRDCNWRLLNALQQLRERYMVLDHSATLVLCGIAAGGC